MSCVMDRSEVQLRMQISEEALNDFIAIYKEEFGEDIDRKEATEMAHRLLSLYDLLARKLPGEQISTSPTPQIDNPLPPQAGFRT